MTETLTIETTAWVLIRRVRISSGPPERKAFPRIYPDHSEAVAAAEKRFAENGTEWIPRQATVAIEVEL